MRIFHWSFLLVLTNFALLSLLAPSGAAQTVATQATSNRVLSRALDKAKITDVLTAQQAAWNQGDVDAFLVGYWQSPELTFSGSGGIARGFAGVRERYQKNYPDRATMGELAFSDLEFRFLGPDAALVLGHWHLKRESKGDVGGVFSLVWQRFREGWKIVHDHTSSVDGL
jgi:L-asparaginase / beta-aspartyl-peptidase